MRSLTENQSLFLDASRAIASQMVVLAHLARFHDLRLGFMSSMAIVIFFWLSGFIITYTTIQKSASIRGYSLREFLFDRAVRLYTPLIPALLLAVFVDLYLEQHGYPIHAEVLRNMEWSNFFGTLFMLQQNPISEVGSQVLGFELMRLKPWGSARPFWSIAVEWWIYVAFAVTYFLHGRILRGEPRMLVLAAFVALIPLFNLVSGIGDNLTLIWVLGALLGAAFSGRIQVQASFAAELRALLRWWPLILLLTVLLLLVRQFHLVTALNQGASFYDLSSALLLGVILCLGFFKWEGGVAAGRLAKLTRICADYSYSLYLVHFTVLAGCWSVGWFQEASMKAAALAFVSTNAVAFLIYLVSERHYPKIKTFLRPLVIHRAPSA